MRKFTAKKFLNIETYFLLRKNFLVYDPDILIVTLFHSPRDFQREYRSLVFEDIPHRRLGYGSLLDMFRYTAMYTQFVLQDTP